MIQLVVFQDTQTHADLTGLYNASMGWLKAICVERGRQEEKLNAAGTRRGRSMQQPSAGTVKYGSYVQSWRLTLYSDPATLAHIQQQDER